MSDSAWFRINRDLLVYKVFYFFFLSGFGSIFPYLPVYFRQIGLPASQVGLLLGLRPIVQFASAPFWAVMADRYRKRKSVLVMSVLSWLIMTMALAFVEPTNEICEIRQGNDTHKRVVNYTKVKTGFFRRSTLWHRAEVDSQTGEETQPQADLDVVPIHVDHSTRRFKTISRSSVKAPKTSNITHVQLGKSEISQGNGTFYSRNTNNLSLPVPMIAGKEQKDHPSHKGDSSSTAMRSSNRKFNEALDSKNNKQLQRFYNKTNPKLKTKTNNTFNTATSKEVSSISEQIKSKHLSRFYKISNLPVENNRRMNFSEVRLQIAHRKHKGKNYFKTPGGETVEKFNENAGRNFTSNAAAPARHIEKNDNSSQFDKRRENKGSPPFVIEFSRIIIPHDLQGTNQKPVHSLEPNIEDSSGDFEGRPLVAETAVVHKIGSHSNELKTEKEKTDISKTFTHISKQPKDNTTKEDLLQLEEKLSKIIPSDHQMSIYENSSPLVGKKGKGNLRVSDELPKNPILSNLSLTHSPILQIHVHNKTFYREIDHKDSLHQSESKFVSHQDTKTGLGVSISTFNETNNFNDSEGKALDGELESDAYHSSSGSGTTLLDSTEEYNSIEGETSFYDTPKEEIKTQTTVEENDGLLKKTDNVSGNLHNIGMQGYEDGIKSKSFNNEMLPQTDDNLSGNFKTSAEAGDASNFMQDSQAVNNHLVGNSDTKLQIWMTNLLKTNTFELKRIFTILLVLVVVGEFLEAPSTTLADASLLEHLGEERRYYGKQRLWGSLGFGLSSFLVGVLLERSRHVVCGDQYTDYMICFCVFALLMVTTLFISTTFKFKYKETDAKQPSVLWALCNIHYGSCLAAACFMGVGHGMSHSFLNWFLEDLGATKTLMGVAVICRSTLDLLTFFVAGSLIKAVGQIKIMISALISYGIAFTLYSLLTNPWWVLPIEMLVGCTYAASWSACTSYMAGAASSESVTTIQGILQGVYWGLGTGSGTIAGGFLIHHIGAVATFRCVACCAFVVCVLFCLAQMKWTQETTATHQLDFEYTYLPTVESKDTEELLRGYRVSKASKNKHSTTRRFEYR